MAKQHQPGFYFFPADWRGDPCVGMCSAASRGLWLEMLLIMNDAAPRGFLVVNGKAPTPDKLALLVRIPIAEVEQGLAELEENGVFSRTKTGIIYSRRMIRDEKIRLQNLQREHPIIKEIRLIISARQESGEYVRCGYCGEESGPFEIDHIIPVSRGGTSEIDNLRIACRPCNRSKGDKTLDEWRN